MSRNRPEKLADRIAAAGNAVSDLARRAETMIDLVGYLRAALAPELSAAVEAASLRDDGTLVVIGASPAWAARLRFEAPALLARCRERHPQATRVKVRAGG